MEADLHSFLWASILGSGTGPGRNSSPVALSERKSEHKTQASHLQTGEIIKECNGWQRQAFYLSQINANHSSPFNGVRWHVLVTAGLPFLSSGALALLRCLMRASGAPKDVFSHFVKVPSFLCCHKHDIDWWELWSSFHESWLPAIHYLQTKICVYLTLRIVIGPLLFYMKLCFHLFKKFSSNCSISWMPVWLVC